MIKQFMLASMVVLGSNNSPSSCTAEPQQSTSGVAATTVSVPVQSNGLTVEQENVRNRLVMDNKPGAIKHLYVISAFSGDVLLYSTVRGKVTSSGKRLAPSTIASSGTYGFRVPALGDNAYTYEVLQDDGTYGTSIEYLYWWDAKGVYHQHYVSGGQIVHISDQPLRVAKVLINLSPAQ